ncbi:MAG: type I-E CRISPR-associated protein Cas6/Cse3/CasE [Burkholderiaceae bacterium]
MHLTRLRLDPRSAQVRRDLGDPYEMHRTLVRAFAGGVDQSPPRLLWRAEPVAAWSSPVVLVQAEVPGDWSVLEALPRYLKGAAETVVSRPVEWLKTGGCLRFRLFGNPTVTRNGKRLGLVTEDAQLAWLSRQGQRFGFEVEAALVTGSEVLRGRKGDGHITLLKVCFEGRLRVNDVAALVRALQQGVGPGKAFGCGLLSLARS